MSGCFDEFLKRVTEDSVNGSSGQFYISPVKAYEAGLAEAAPTMDGHPIHPYTCRQCRRPVRTLEYDGYCRTCTEDVRVETTAELLIEWAAGSGQVVCLSIHDETLPEAAVYVAARRAARWALDAIGRDA